MKLVTAMLAGLCAWQWAGPPCGVPAAAADSVRVLLSQDAQRIDLRAGDRLTLLLSNGEQRAVRPPISFTAVGGSIALNGEKTPADGLVVRASSGHLALVIAAGPSSGLSVNANGVPPGSDMTTTLEVAGQVSVLRRGKGLMIVNELDLEEYVKGVVPSEVNAAWHPEVLKAQAVAARTYALYQRMVSAGRDYDLVAGTQDQVYRGRHGIDGRIEQAVEETRGLVVTYQQAPIYAAFSSTAAGLTEDALNVWSKDLPYLKGVECPFDVNSPYYRWRASFKLETLERNLRQQGIAVGTIVTLAPASYSRAGRVTKLRVLHSGGELYLRGEDLRRVIGYAAIPSTQFDLDVIGPDVVVSGYGAGHAVGLCQWGAKELAELGYSFATILGYYYPGTELQSASLVRPPSVPGP
ncbi:MAG: SpoIID/LytB domain-containing protein [Nitrospirota bacterium]